MRHSLTAALFAAFSAMAVPALALDTAVIEDLREGSMKKLVFDSTPAVAPDTVFGDLDGGSHSLSDWRGKVVLVNFWATWCAPCRAEMPELDALQAEFGGGDFEVLTIAAGRNAPAGIRRFFEEEGITNLPTLTDHKQALARDMAVLGLPITVLLDRQGREIARLRGDASWYGDSARAIISALLAAPADG